MTSHEPVGTLLTWDTDFFGVRVARIFASSAAQVPEACAFLDEERIQLCYALVPCANVEVVEALQANGFLFRDVRVELVMHDWAPPGAQSEVRDATQADMPSLLALATVAHENTRFFKEPSLNRERCGALYHRWLERSFEEPTHQVLTVDKDGTVAGYITLVLDGQSAELGLLAVDARFRRRGVARELLNGALARARASNVRQVSVVTQGDNIAALRLYEQAGFTTHSVNLWLHRARRG